MLPGPAGGNHRPGSAHEGQAREPWHDSSRREGARMKLAPAPGPPWLGSPDHWHWAVSLPHRRTTLPRAQAFPAAPSLRPRGEQWAQKGGTLLGQKNCCECFLSSFREASTRVCTPPSSSPLPSTRESTQWLRRKLENIRNEVF